MFFKKTSILKEIYIIFFDGMATGKLRINL